MSILLLKLEILSGTPLAHLNIHEQKTIDIESDIISNSGLTYNQSKLFKDSGTSSNNHVMDKDLLPITYSHTLLRFIRYILESRNH